MQRNNIERANQRTVPDLEILDQIELVELSAACRQIRQIPPRGRGFSAPPLPAVQHSAALQNPVDGPRARSLSDRLPLEFRSDRDSAKLPQVALLLQFSSQSHDLLFDCGSRPPRRASRPARLITPLHSIKPPSFGPNHPALHRPQMHTVTTCHGSLRLPSPNRCDHLATLAFRGSLLFIGSRSWSVFDHHIRQAVCVIPPGPMIAPVPLPDHRASTQARLNGNRGFIALAAPAGGTRKAPRNHQGAPLLYADPTGARVASQRCPILLSGTGTVAQSRRVSNSIPKPKPIQCTNIVSRTDAELLSFG